MLITFTKFNIDMIFMIIMSTCNIHTGYDMSIYVSAFLVLLQLWLPTTVTYFLFNPRSKFEHPILVYEATLTETSVMSGFCTLGWKHFSFKIVGCMKLSFWVVSKLRVFVFVNATFFYRVSSLQGISKTV